jgi:glyoxylase-like metal-dependent hydrolase (beta-lactamase superfamily II)
MRIIPLSEGSFSIDKTKKFVPFDVTSDNLQQRPTGSLLVEVQPFVVITSEDVLLLDTGLGFETNGHLQLHQNLMHNGINPSQITKVLITHLHKDHAGGVSKLNNGKYETAFPNATYYIQQQEMNFAMQTGFPSFIPQEIEILKTAANVVWLNGNGIINGYIKHHVTGAHSPHHQVFWIVDGGETIFFGGDVAPQLGQMKSRFVAKYDYDGKLCMQLRHTWWQQANEEGWTFLFYHDIKTPVYQR